LSFIFDWFDWNLMVFEFVMKHISKLAVVSVIAIGLMTTGCGGEVPPEIVPASGVLTLGGKPLPNAEVRFMPMQEGLDANYVASAVTDKDGAFTLTMPAKTESGCCACLCRVLVSEGPVPDALRKGHENGTNLGGLRKFMDSLPNRPIPPNYSRVGSTPLSYEVSAENNEFKIELKR
jgi:hypothetical protein